MITLTNGRVQNQSGMAVPNGSISFQLNLDASIIASPGGLIPASQIVIFQFDANGDLIQPATLWSNAELNPQNVNGLGTFYLVTIYDANGAPLNASPMYWQFTNAANSTVDISTMTAYFTGGTVIYYPFVTGGESFPAAPPLGSLQGNNASHFGGVLGSSIDFTNGLISLTPPGTGVALTITGDAHASDIQDWFVNGGGSPAVSIASSGTVSITPGISSVTALKVSGTSLQTAIVGDFNGGASTLTPSSTFTFRGIGLGNFWAVATNDIGPGLVEFNVESTYIGDTNPATQILLTNNTAGPATTTATAIQHDDSGHSYFIGKDAAGNTGALIFASGILYLEVFNPNLDSTPLALYFDATLSVEGDLWPLTATNLGLEASPFGNLWLGGSAWLTNTYATGFLDVAGAAASTTAGHLQIGSAVATPSGSSGTAVTTNAAGGSGPAAPTVVVGYIEWYLGSQKIWIPYCE